MLQADQEQQSRKYYNDWLVFWAFKYKTKSLPHDFTDVGGD